MIHDFIFFKNAKTVADDNRLGDILRKLIFADSLILVSLILIGNGILPVVPFWSRGIIAIVAVGLEELTILVGSDGTVRNRPEEIALVNLIVQSLL